MASAKRLSAFLDAHPVVETAALMFLAFLGGAALDALGVPAGWLTGAMALVAAFGLLRPWQGPSEPVVQVGMLLSGVIIGSAATPEAIQSASRYPGSLLLLMASLAATMFVTGALLVRFGGWSRLDAMLAAAPGALSAVMAVAREATPNLARIAIIQFFRLFILVAALPSLLVMAGVNASSPLPAAAAPPSWGDAAIMLACGVGLALAFRAVRVVAPAVLGGAVASMALHATDLVHGALPAPLAILAFLILGGMTGARLGGLDRPSLRALLPLALAAFAASVAVAAFLAWPAAALAGVSYPTAFIAFAPGGLEAMALLALLLGLDPLYVGAHHLVRFMAVGFLLPVLVRLLGQRDAG
jgi:membrane AbrB-like protein